MRGRYNHYSPEVMAEKKKFIDWLVKRRYKKDTIRVISNYAAHYLDWLESEKIIAPEAQYRDVVAYLSFQREKEESERLAGNRLTAVRHYYQYLRYGNNGQSNPAEKLFVRNQKRCLVHDVLAKEQLLDIYQSYPNETSREKRNKSILGILVNQGLRKEEIPILKAHHLKLREGKLVVPPNGLTNGRTIKLASNQILDLQEYLLVIRPQILKEMNRKNRFGRKPTNKNQNAETDQLFISMHGSLVLKASLHHLMGALRKEYEELKGCQQIRMSVITHWLKEKDIREVQYLAGFRHLDSLAYYQKYHTEELEAELKKYHPLSRASTRN